MHRSHCVTSAPARFDHSRALLLAVPLALICFLCLVLLPGAARADSPAGCDDPASPVFAPWGDTDQYRLAPGGDFEDSAEGWTLSKRASIDPGASPLGGSSVLTLPAGASAVSAPICIDDSTPHARMFVQSSGNLVRTGRVLVEAISPTGLSVPVGIVRGDEDWNLSNRFAAPAWWVLRDGIVTFQYKLTSVGINDSSVDSLYVDPRSRW